MDLTSTSSSLADSSKVDANFAEIARQIETLGNSINGGGELVVVDDYPDLASAQIAARERKGELFFRSHEYLVNIELQHGDIISGESRYGTILKSPPGSNSTVIHGADANRVIIRNLTIDGNRANNPISGDGLSLWGYAPTISDVTIQNCRHDGMNTAWSDGSVSMEGTFQNIVIDTVGYHGWRFNGPHDSHVSNMMIIDASQETDNGFIGVHIGPSGNGRFVNLHVWHRSGTANRCWAGFNSSGGCEVIASHIEGCRGQQVRHNGSGDRLIGCLIYAPFGVNSTSLVVFNGDSNQHIGCKYLAGNGAETNNQVYAMQFGDANASWNNHVIGGLFHGFDKKSPFNFWYSGGLNQIEGRGYAAAGGAISFTGSPNATDEIDYYQGGTVINYRKTQAYPVYSSNSAAASGGVPVTGLYILSSTNALTIRV